MDVSRPAQRSFAAVGVEGGLIVLVVYKAAPNGRAGREPGPLRHLVASLLSPRATLGELRAVLNTARRDSALPRPTRFSKFAAVRRRAR
ncbi:MAG TPA: hypothetical protein VGQ36_26835, partial [Thermoanaerobaculia bacterium]|nr:hypothetical protein [Thermoanaerobaculia bacterium]